MCPKRYRRMIDIVRDWLAFAIGLVGFVLQIWSMVPPRRHRRQRERFRRFRIGKVEWTSYDRDDDRQS